MAFAARVVAEIIGYALIAVVERGQRSSLGRALAAWRWFHHVAEAPAGLKLVAPDGSAYTGIVFLERSRAVLLFAIHHPANVPPHAQCGDWPEHHSLGLFEDDDASFGAG